MAVPRDVDEAVGELPGVARYDIDDLQGVLDENMAQREAAIPQVEVIIAQTEQGRGILGVVDGFASKGIETEQDAQDRRSLLRAIGYKL